MRKLKQNTNEQRYYDALKLIAKEYMTSKRLIAKSEDLYGLTPIEALEMAYDGMQGVAAAAIRGKRRPKDPVTKP